MCLKRGEYRTYLRVQQSLKMAEGLRLPLVFSSWFIKELSKSLSLVFSSWFIKELSKSLST